MALPKNDRNALIVAAYRSGDNLRKIAVAHELSHERVRQIVAREPGLLRTSRFLRRKDVDEKTLRKLAERGLTLGEIADRLGMAETNVRVRLNGAGIALTARRRAKDRVPA